MRKHGTDITFVAISARVSLYGVMSGISSFPQSNTYKRTEGGAGAGIAAATPRTLATKENRIRRMMRADMTVPLGSQTQGTIDQIQQSCRAIVGPEPSAQVHPAIEFALSMSSPASRAHRAAREGD